MEKRNTKTQHSAFNAQKGSNAQPWWASFVFLHLSLCPLWQMGRSDGNTTNCHYKLSATSAADTIQHLNRVLICRIDLQRFFVKLDGEFVFS